MMHHLPKHYKWILFFIILVVALSIAVPVLADYLGPNRTVTTTVSVCKVYLYKCTEVEPGKWKDVKVEDWLCSNESKPWEAYDSGGACHSGNDGHKHWEKKDVIQTITTTYPAATIAGSINCTQQNGWCNGSTTPALALSANEPLAGYNITLIEGTLNGISFACPSGATSCSLPMNQGDNIFNYWALSSWGDSSLMGTTTAKVDTVPPEVSLSVTGTAGKNGWYKSAVQVSVVASDATSGVATFEVAVDGGGYQAYVVPISFSNDALHTLQFRVVDNAGNLFETAVQNFYMDTIPPTVNLPASWQLGRNVPYDVIDEGSGLGALRIVIEDEDEKYAKVAWDQQVSGHTYSQDIDWNGQFKDKTVAPPGTYLVWLKASDVAGNEHFELGKVIVPEPSYVGPVVLPTEAPAVSVAPPAELSQPEDPTALLPSTIEGTTTTTQHFTLTSGVAAGTAGAASATTTSGVLWGAMAAAAISAATVYALDATRKRKEAEEAQAAAVKAEVARSKAERAEKQQKQKENYEKQKALEQAIQAYQQKKKQEAAYNTHMEEKMAKFEEQEQAHWLAMQAAIKKKDEEKKKAEEQQTKLTSYFNSERHGVPKVLAAPAPDDDPPKKPGPLEWLWNGVKAVWNGVFGTRQPAPPTPVQPDVDTLAKAYMTVIAQVTQTAQALPTSTPTIISTPTSFFTPTPVRTPLIVLSDGLNLRSQPTINGPVLASIPKGSIVYVEQNSETAIGDNYCWRKVSYTDPKINARAIAASPNFLNPLSDFNRITQQGDPISYYNAVPGWDNKHIGNDLVPADSANPNPPVFASASGIVIRAGTQTLNDKIVGYGNYVIIEYQAGSLPAPIHNLPEYKSNDSLYAMYAHLKEDMSNILKSGINITPGMQVGTMGDSGNTGNFTHLHLELRLGEPATDSNGLKNLNASNGDWYNANRLPPLDPALVFTPKDTWTGWVAQSQWDAQTQCSTGDPYLGAP